MRMLIFHFIIKNTYSHSYNRNSL